MHPHNYLPLHSSLSAPSLPPNHPRFNPATTSNPPTRPGPPQPAEPTLNPTSPLTHPVHSYPLNTHNSNTTHNNNVLQFKRQSIGTPRNNPPLNFSQELKQSKMGLMNGSLNLPGRQSKKDSPVKTSSKKDIDVEKLQWRVKELENQLKFEEKYANDLFKASEGHKIKLGEVQSELDSIKKKQGQAGSQFQTEKQQRQQVEKAFNQLQVKYRVASGSAQKQKQSQKQHQLQVTHKDQVIVKLNSQVKDLKEQITALTNANRNPLYEAKITELNEELAMTHADLTQLKLQKTQLSQELRNKNEQIMVLKLEQNTSTIGSPSKAKRVEGIYEKTNQAINQAFDEYRQEAERLKGVIERKDEEHRRLREEIVSGHKQVESLKEEIRIMGLKEATERKNLQQQKENRLAEKDNEIKYVRNQLAMVEERYAKAQREIEEKDRFLQEHLVGRAKQLETKQFILETVGKYAAIGEGRQETGSDSEERQAART